MGAFSRDRWDAQYLSLGIHQGLVLGFQMLKSLM